MSFAETLKSLVYKKPASEDVQKDPRKKGRTIEGGRRAGENSNPYLAARRTWNDHIMSLVSQRQAWQLVGLMAMLIALAAVGGLIHTAQQSKFIPYVIEVDKLGRTVAAGQLQSSTKVDHRVVNAALADWIGCARLVTPDIRLQEKCIYRVYSMLSGNDPAKAKMDDFMKSPEHNPMARAANEIVNIEITTIIPQTPETWQVEWIETTRERQGGAMQSAPVAWRALITTYVADTTTATTDEQLRLNPLGIFIRDYSWSRIK